MFLQKGSLSRDLSALFYNLPITESISDKSVANGVLNTWSIAWKRETGLEIGLVLL